MNYSALYRTYRPQTFDEVVGQDGVIKTLKNQIKNEKVGHAYLFNGTRGTGKTSIAKIFSRAINCPNQKDGEPCNECDICKDALSNSLPDIVEMDAASNNSVEDIRQIRDEINFLPAKAKYRIYIIDEVHMLSIGAFNALLKTLEEPPEHVKFILATTEPQKIPATILSRCQRYDFKKISIEDISKRLRFVCDSQKIGYCEESIRLIASLSDGALRDGLSILDRVVQSNTNIEDVLELRNLIGMPSMIQIGNLIEKLVAKDLEGVLKLSQEVLDDGKDPEKILDELVKYLRDILIYKYDKTAYIYNEDEKKQIEKLSSVDNPVLLNLIFELSSLENNVKQTSQKSVIFSAGLIGILSCGTSKSDPNLENRVLKLESYLKNMSFNRMNINTNKVSVPKQVFESKPQATKTQQNVTDVSASSGDFWENFLVALKQMGKMVLYTQLANANAKLETDNLVAITFPGQMSTFNKQSFSKQENIEIIRSVLTNIFKKDMNFKIYQSEFVENLTPQQEFEKIAKDNNVEIKVEE